MQWRILRMGWYDIHLLFSVFLRRQTCAPHPETKSWRRHCLCNLTPKYRAGAYRGLYKHSFFLQFLCLLQRSVIICHFRVLCIFHPHTIVVFCTTCTPIRMLLSSFSAAGTPYSTKWANRNMSLGGGTCITCSGGARVSAARGIGPWCRPSRLGLAIVPWHRRPTPFDEHRRPLDPSKFFDVCARYREKFYYRCGPLPTPLVVMKRSE